MHSISDTDLYYRTLSIYTGKTVRQLRRQALIRRLLPWG